MDQRIKFHEFLKYFVKNHNPGQEKSKSGLRLPKRFEQFIEDKRLFDRKAKILLAVSGGVDSMVMLSLFANSGFNIAVAHCNFGLRGQESDDDASFVEQESKKMGVDYFSKTFDTISCSKTQKQSIQEAARELRYQWFSQLAKDMSFDHIATGHNLNDSIETLIINLTRGTGLRGLGGIPVKNGNIIRPLVFATRREIEEHASANSINFRIDSSNNQDYYLRNKIRHHVVPLLEEANPNLYSTIFEYFGIVSGTLVILDRYVDNQRVVCVAKTQAGYSINIAKLLEANSPKLILFEFLKEFGFSSTVCTELFNSLCAQPGKRFSSNTHCAIKDRTEIFVEPINPKTIDTYATINEKATSVEVSGQNFCISNLLFKVEMEISKDPNVVWVDKDKLEFPLILRKIIPGDSMTPIGLNGKKKVSDILIDLKVPLHLKEKVLVLVSGREIVWLVGLRVSDRFKITPNTKNIFEIARTCDKYHV